MKKGKYDDIILLPHHQSETRPHMPMSERAAQFLPFAALTGYGDELTETARLTEERRELTEEKKTEISRILQQLEQQLCHEKSVQVLSEWFEPDPRKDGGFYHREKIRIRRIDSFRGILLLSDGREIPIRDLAEIQPSEEGDE